jgi:hypothetical protein
MPVMRKTNQSDPKREERALRLFLLQTRGLEAWSDAVPGRGAPRVGSETETAPAT